MADETINYGDDAQGGQEGIDPATGQPYKRKPLPSQAPPQYAAPGPMNNAGAGMASLAPTAAAPGTPQYLQRPTDYGASPSSQIISDEEFEQRYPQANDPGDGSRTVEPVDSPGFAPDETPGVTPPGTTPMPPGQPSSNPTGPSPSWKTDNYPPPQFTVPPPSRVPGAFDATNWNDPNMQTPKYVIGRIAAQYAGRLNDPEALKQLGAEIQKAYPSARFDGKDRISGIPGISGTVDFIANAGAPNAEAWWNDESGGSVGPGPGGGGPGGPGAPGGEPIPTLPGPSGPGAPIPSVPGTPGGTGTRGPEWQKLYDELIKRSQQGLDVDPNDPIIKGQVDAATAIANREALKQQQAAAERGGPYASGATANAQRMSNEAVQIQSSVMQAELMSREVGARRQEIREALSGRQGMLTAEEASRLKELDQQLEREQMSLADKHALLADKHASFQDMLNERIANENFGHRAWQRGFDDRDWESRLAQTNWENEKSIWG